ncbi:MAG TPA: efflux RND transporter periplasmic adaptor subunit [Chthonomonadaceae bacterium]|nr:efflux RND transporter periplasmic adaptor subunit [Chthonomonadaceae bacterium]
MKGRLLSPRNISLSALMGLLALLLVLSGGCRKGAEAPKADEDATGPVTVELAAASVHAMQTTVTAMGTLASGQGGMARVAPTVPGRLLHVNVKEGDRVTQGQVIAVLDNRPQQAALASAQAALNSSEAQAQEAKLAAQAAATDQANAVHLAKLALDSARLDRDNAVKAAQNALQAAETDQKKTQAGARPQEIAQADQAVVQAKATRDHAAIDLDRQQKLLAIGFAAKKQVEEAQTNYDVADSAWKVAQQQASLVKAGARPEDLQAAQLRVEGAQEALRQAQTSGDAKVAQAQATLKQAQESALQVQVKEQDAQAQAQTARQKQADLNNAQALTNYAEVRAPLSGVVTRRALNPGDMADITNPIIEVADTQSLNLIANMPASEGLKVRVGLPVEITSQDAPDKTFQGSVLSVGQVDPQSNLLAVRIAVYNASGTLKVGSFATAEIILHSDPHAVVVPKECVLTRDGKNVVYVVGSDKVAHQKEVTVGPEQDNLVAITQGVAIGEKVVKLGQFELTDGAKIEEASKEDTGDKKEGDKADEKAADKSDEKSAEKGGDKGEAPAGKEDDKKEGAKAAEKPAEKGGDKDAPPAGKAADKEEKK